MSDATYEKIEPTLNLEEFKDSTSDYWEYFIYRPDVDPAKLAMGIHPVGVPFHSIEFGGSVFYVIEGKLWEKGHVGVDDKGVFVEFHKQKGEFKGYGV
jgi:hypothetical protein